MNTRERFHAVAEFKEFDRLPVLEWASWWDKTLERWRNEGLPEKLTDRYDICRYFDLDTYFQFWCRAIHRDAPGPAAHGAGIIKTEKDYDAIRQHLFRIEDRWPVDRGELAEKAAVQDKGDAVIWFSFDGFFWLPRALFGIEDHLYAFYDQPELMRRINSENAEWMLKVVDMICEICVPDFMTFAEDMNYNNGPMLSKELFDEFLKPYYDIVIPHLKKKGIRVFIDSDGDVTASIDWFKAAGIEGVLPLEAQAGVDISGLRENHSDMLFMGAFDKMTMPLGEDAMRKEFERLRPVAGKGGFFVSCDHQTPPGVSLENYRAYLKLFREFATSLSD